MECNTPRQRRPRFFYPPESPSVASWAIPHNISPSDAAAAARGWTGGGCWTGTLIQGHWPSPPLRFLAPFRIWMNRSDSACSITHILRFTNRALDFFQKLNHEKNSTVWAENNVKGVLHRLFTLWSLCVLDPCLQPWMWAVNNHSVASSFFKRSE